MSKGSSFLVKNMFETIITTETQLLEPLLNRRHEIERMSKSINMTHKYSTLFKLPVLMLSYKNQQDFDQVVELFAKHIGVLRKFKSVSLLGKLLVQVEDLAHQVKGEILQQLNQAKTLDMVLIEKSIKQLKTLDSTFDATEFCLTHLHGRVVSQIASISKESGLATHKWLQVSTKDTAEDETEALLALEQIVERCEAELKLLRDVAEYYLEEENTKDRSVRAQKLIKSAAKVFIKEFLAKAKEDAKYGGMSDSISGHLQTMAPLLKCSIYTKFLQTYMVNFVKWKLNRLADRIAKLWQQETWGKDTMNTQGTALPRTFVMLLTETLEDLKLQTGEVKVYDSVCEGFVSTVERFLDVLAVSLRKSNCAFADVSKSDMILLTMSNAEFLRTTAVPELLKSISLLFVSEDETLLTQHTQERASSLIDSYLDSFAEKFADYQTEPLSEATLRLCYLEPTEFDMKYSDYLEGSGKSFLCVSPGAHNLATVLSRIESSLNQKSKQLKLKVMKIVVDKLAKIILTALQSFSQNVQPHLFSHILLDLEYLNEVLKFYSQDKFPSILAQLRKLIAEHKGIVSAKYKQDQLERNLFSQEELEQKTRILSSALHRTRLAFETLKTPIVETLA
mmetsp:Transcript_19114/g.34789  ORF Transcript_19114/g.34789 Transcript_19114/m.34789 type:complete len:621 (+) Transcript_19114:897-2759(+)